MSLTAAKQRFGTYLAQPIVKYPISRIPLSAKMGQDKRKELIFQQKLFLDVALDYVETKPWVSYFAAVKHFRVVDANSVNTATFNDLRDKEFATEVASAAESLRDSSTQLLDTETIECLEELSILQELSPLLPAARSTLSELRSSPHRAAVVAAFGGQTPPTGCGAIMIALGIAFAVCMVIAAASSGRSSSSGSADAVLFLITIVVLLIGSVFAHRQWTHWQAVTQLLDRFRADVVPVAELLRVSPLGWLQQPEHGMATLRDLETHRKQLEDTFLVLDDH